MMLEALDSDMAGLLVPGEEVLLTASQSKFAPGGSISAPDKIYITTHRILFKDPKMFGFKADIISLRYEEISTVMLKRGVFSTEILLKPRASLNHIDLAAVDKQLAQQISLHIQKGMRGELLDYHTKSTLTANHYPGVRKFRTDSIEKTGSSSNIARVEDEDAKISFAKNSDNASSSMQNIDSSTRVSSKQPKQESATSTSIPGNSIAETDSRISQKDAKEPIESQIACKYCSYASVPVQAKYCPDCGKDLRSETNIWKMCPSCDAIATNDASFCTFCRQKFPPGLS